MDETREQSQNRVTLNPEMKSPRAQEFESRLGSLIVGQVRAVVFKYQTLSNIPGGYAEPGPAHRNDAISGANRFGQDSRG